MAAAIRNTWAGTGVVVSFVLHAVLALSVGVLPAIPRPTRPSEPIEIEVASVAPTIPPPPPPEPEVPAPPPVIRTTRAKSTPPRRGGKSCHKVYYRTGIRDPRVS